MAERVKLSKESMESIFNKRNFTIYSNISVDIICNILDINYNRFKRLIDFSDYDMSELRFEYYENLVGTNIKGLNFKNKKHIPYAFDYDNSNYDFYESDRLLTNLPFITKEEIETLKEAISKKGYTETKTNHDIKVKKIKKYIKKYNKNTMLY